MEIERTAKIALREEVREEAVEKRKWTAPIPVTSHYSPRKQRKVALPSLPAQDPSLSSLPDDFQVVLAGRARRQRALEEQTLGDEQSLLDGQLLWPG